MKAIASLFVFFVLLSIPLRSQWVKCESPTGGDVHSITHLGNSLIAGLTGGVYRSTDNGDSWSLVGLKNEVIQTVVAKGSVLVAGTLTGNVYRTTDTGATWSLITIDSLHTSIRCFAVSGTLLYAGTAGNGVFRSSDDGQTWSAENTGLKDNSQFASAFAIQDTMLFVATSDGVYSKPIDGNEWTKRNNGPENKGVVSLAVKGQMIFASTAENGVYVSNDHGKNWERKSLGLPKQPYISSMIVVGNTLFVGLFDRSNSPEDVHAIYRSTDNGDTWLKVNEGLDITCFYSNGASLFAGTNHWAVCKSNESGELWQQAKTGMPQRGFVTMDVHGSILIGGTVHGGLFMSSDNGDHWVEANVPFREHSVYVTKSDTVLIAGRDYGADFYKSYDNGRSWSGCPQNKIQFFNILSALGTTIFAASDGDGSLWTSRDNGDHWERWSTNPLRDAFTYSIVAHDTNLYFGAASGVWRLNKADSGWNITAIKGLEQVPNVVSYDIKALAVMDTFLFAGNYGIFRNSTTATTENTWKRMDAGVVSSTPLPRITDLKGYGSVIYAATKEGTYYSTTKGDYWREITWDTDHLTSAKFVIKDKTIFAYNAQGVWKLNPATLSADEDTFPGNTAPQLLCYPNPATNSLTIDRTSLPFVSGVVSYTILSVTGEKVYESEIAEPRLSLPVNTLPTGVYSLVARQGMVRTSVVFTVVR